eukprot:gene13344-13458_t
MIASLRQKAAGAYYTPHPVVQSLLKWAIRSETDRFLDPACGDGRFIASHKNSVGIEQDAAAARIAIHRAPWALVHEGDFFAWAAETSERFTAIGGNPPFIRYQTFKGDVRARAIALCDSLGARFNGLASSWAPFLVASASLLDLGGRMAFVIPAEIGHAPYSAPALEYLTSNFETVHIVAYRDKLFPELSEDCWLLYAEGFGGKTSEIRFTAFNEFVPLDSPPVAHISISVTEWRLLWKRRLRPFILPTKIRDIYVEVINARDTKRLRDLARVGIGYVSGNNDFFHLRPSQADKWNLPKSFLRPTVRRSEYLPAHQLTAATVEEWLRADQQVLLLEIPKSVDLPVSVRQYLDTDEAKFTQTAYKCKNRTPWNDARATCTNSVHAVRFHHPDGADALNAVWDTNFLRLSCELEGHPLGGGMLKLEPGEAAQIPYVRCKNGDIMPPRNKKTDSGYCEWINEREAFRRFATHSGGTESAKHIKPLHWRESRRGQKGDRMILVYDPSKAGKGEQIILAVSCKGMTKAFRNLSNRMEETIGYYALLRANRTLQDAKEASTTEDAPVDESEVADESTLPEPDGEKVTDSIIRFERALSEMSLRQGIRDEISRYEAMALALVEPKGDLAGCVFQGFPAENSPMNHQRFFKTLYQRYEERFVIGAPLLAERGVTTRFEWAPDSPAFEAMELDFLPRLASAVRPLGAVEKVLEAMHSVLVSSMDFSFLTGCASQVWHITSGVCRAVAACLGGGVRPATLPQDLVMEVHRRVVKAQVRLIALMERVRAGRSFVRPGRASVVLVGGGLPRVAVRRGVWLPRRFGWLIGLVGHEAAGRGSQLAALLEEPEMVALVRDVPEARRILAPLCWMLGVAFDPLRAPRKARVRVDRGVADLGAVGVAAPARVVVERV